MKFNEAIPSIRPSDDVMRVSAAKFQSVTAIKAILREEAEHSTDWFLTGRKSRLAQLASDIFAIKLNQTGTNVSQCAITEAIRDVSDEAAIAYQSIAAGIRK